MLEQLSIRNLATIESLDLELQAGFTVLSGETGAGKSILIDALGLVLGTRAEPALVRAGSERADISASFRIHPQSGPARWLREQELPEGDGADTVLLRRVLAAEGRTRAFINGSAVTAASLRELGEQLVDVYGQNESHSLRLADVQRDMLDAFARHAPLLDEVAARAREWRALEQQIEQARGASAREPAELDLLRHQVRELAALQLKDGELDQLEAEHRRLANAGRILQDGALAQDQLYGGDASAHDQLAAAGARLRALAPLHEGFAAAETLVESARALTREAASELRRLLDRLDLDPARPAEVDARMAGIHELARKHRVRADELPARLLALQAELHASEHAGELMDALRAQQVQALAAWREAARALSASRREAATSYAEQVSACVRELGMPHARFEVNLEPATDARPRAHGADELRFDFSANPGQPPRALARVASGGELSRISLALQVVAQEGGGAPTMIFDEIDAGIGGSVAEAVGRALHALGARRQVLCVTHLGQVAACGDQHLAVSKQVREGQTYTAITPLSGKARVAELARMIGGKTASAATEAMARELLRSARSS